MKIVWRVSVGCLEGAWRVSMGYSNDHLVILDWYSQDRAGQVRTGPFRTGLLRMVNNIATIELCSNKTNTPSIVTSTTNHNQLVKLELLKSELVKSGHFKLGHIKSSQDWSSQFGLSQIKSWWGRSNQVMTGQVNMGR